MLEEFWIMSHFECRLNRRFCCSKKVVQIGGGGGGEEFGQNPIEQRFFSRETVPYIAQFNILVQFTF